jgi:hypothetical protein
MRRINYNVTILSLLTIFVALYSSCSQSAKSEIQQEAESRAQKWWDASVAKCGDYYYTRVKWSDFVRGQLVHENEFYQLKNASYYVKETPLTEATKLNGIEWQGRIAFVASAHRKHTDSWGWTPWTDGVPPTQSDLAPLVEARSLLDKGFSKKNGQWEIGEDGKEITGEPTHTKPDCSEIPPE